MFQNVFLFIEGLRVESYATLYERWHRPTSKQFFKDPYSISRASPVDSDCCRLPTASAFSDKVDKFTPQSVLINKSKFFKVIRQHTELKRIITPRSMIVEALSW